MNNEERELINKFFDRVGGQSSSPQGSVPTTNRLPPLDPEADRLIKDNFQRFPEASYRITQMAVVQEAALVEAQNRIRQLEWQLNQTSQQLQQTQQQQAQQPPAGGGGFFGGLFGGGNRNPNQGPQQRPQQPNQMPPPGWGGNPGPQNQGQRMNNNPYGAPPPQNYPPGYQQGMFNRGGSGFLGSALTTAAGVAGGMFAYNALSGLFSGGHSAAPGAAADPTAAAADPFAGSDPFSGAGTSVDPGFDAGAGAGFDNNTDFGGAGADAGWGDNSNTAADDGGDWGGGADDGGWGDEF